MHVCNGRALGFPAYFNYFIFNLKPKHKIMLATNNTLDFAT